MSKHTPGPWRKGRPGIGSTMFSTLGKTLGKVYHNHPFQGERKDVSKDISIEEAMANLSLIAAAPDLLAACEAAVSVYDEMGADDVVASQLRAAIAKAKGE